MIIVIVGMDMMQVITNWTVGFAKFMWLGRNWRIYRFVNVLRRGMGRQHSGYDFG